MQPTQQRRDPDWLVREVRAQALMELRSEARRKAVDAEKERIRRSMWRRLLMWWSN